MIKHVHSDLRGQFGPIRNQGPRPTCLAFAASDINAALNSKGGALSCEYIFYMAQKRANKTPNDGATLVSMLAALELDGQPVEHAWPYSFSSPDIAKWNPPPNVGQLYYAKGSSASALFDIVVKRLVQGFPMLILTYLSQSFFIVDTNGIVDPPATELPEKTQRHALLAVGHGETINQRAILVRNSWGAKWGSAGYAWLTESFLSSRLFAAATF